MTCEVYVVGGGMFDTTVVGEVVRPVTSVTILLGPLTGRAPGKAAQDGS